MPQRRYYHVNYQDLLSTKKPRQNRVLALLDALHKGKNPSLENIFEPEHKNIEQQTDIEIAAKDSPTSAVEESTQIPSISINEAEENPGWFIQSDNKLSKAGEYLDNALSFIEVVKQAENKAKTCFEKIGEEDRIIQDLLHEIRQPVKDAETGYNLYKLLHQAERRRQDYKDLAEPLCLIAKYVNTHKGVFEGFIPIIKAAKQRVENQKTRVYMQKSDSLQLPVGDAYRKLPKTEQEKIKAIYEQNKNNKDRYSFTV